MSPAEDTEDLTESGRADSSDEDDGDASLRLGMCALAAATTSAEQSASNESLMRCFWWLFLEASAV